MTLSKKSRYFAKASGSDNDCERQTPSTLSSQPRWTPPRSPFNLIQEDLFHDPWKLLVATIFLNRTGGDRAVPLALEFLDRWQNPQAALQAKEDDIAELLQPLGLNRRRARVIQRFSGKKLVILTHKTTDDHMIEQKELLCLLRCNFP